MLKFCSPHGRRREYKVNPGSKAANRGIREGDIITSINGESTKDKTNSETHSMLKSAGDVLKLGLNEEGVSPKKRQYRTVQQQETHSSETTKRTNSTIHVITTTKKEIHHGNNNNSFERNIEENSKTNGKL
nr:PDZ and LIM domain protein 1-like isoform X2 [Onthophagus taurus]